MPTNNKTFWAAFWTANAVSIFSAVFAAFCETVFSTVQTSIYAAVKTANNDTLTSTDQYSVWYTL